MERIKLREGAYVAEDKFGYKIVYPTKRNKDLPLMKDKIYLKNLFLGGSWMQFFKTLAIMIMMGSLLFGYWQGTTECKYMIENPVEVCEPICEEKEGNLTKEGDYEYFSFRDNADNRGTD